MDDKKQENVNNQAKASYEKQPDEKGGILVESHIKIFDPETKEEFVNGRA